MDESTRTSRFARFAEDGTLLALVADGEPTPPEYPADGNLSALSDADLGTLHETLMGEVHAAIADPAADPAAGDQLYERVMALRNEAATRMAADPADGEGAGDGSGDGAGDAGDGSGAGDAGDADTGGDGSGDAGDGDAGGDGSDGDDAATLARRQTAANLRSLEAPTAPGVQLTTIDPAEIAGATAAAITQGMTPMVEALGTMAEGMALATRELAAARSGGGGIDAQARRPLDARGLGAYRSPDAGAPGHSGEPGRRPGARGRLIHTGDAPGIPQLTEFSDMDALVDAYCRRNETLGRAITGQDERVIIASYRQDDFEERRDFRGLGGMDGRELRRRIREFCGPESIGFDPWNPGRELPLSMGGVLAPGGWLPSLQASGGLAAPVEPYYGQLVLAEAMRQVFGAMPSVVAERGGIRLVPPIGLGTMTSATPPGQFSDGVSAGGTTDFSSATAAFTQADVGRPIVEVDGGTHIPAGTIIDTVNSGTDVTLSANTSGAATGITFYLPARNPNNLGGPVAVVTAAQDAAGPPNTVKFTFDVPDGSQIEHDVYSTYASLQFANLTARTFPEQVEAAIRVADALRARVADTQALNYITGWSTLLTGAKTFGTSRQLLAQFEHMAAYYRNHNRMDPKAVLRLLIPAWAINAMRGDFISTFIGGGAAGWGLSDEELLSWFQDRAILPVLYWDGPSDVSQLFLGPGSGAINTGGNNTATPVAIPDYPGSGSGTAFRTKIVSFMWAEGTWLGLTTGELNIGLVRDSILNSQNRFRNFEESWETPAFVGLESLRCVHTVASDGTYGAAASVTLGAGNGL